MYAVSRLDTTILPSLTEVKQPFAGQPDILKNKKCFSKAACPIKSSSYFHLKAMAGYTIANQQSLHYLTLAVIGWVDVFSRDCYRTILLESLGISGRRHSIHLTGDGRRHLSVLLGKIIAAQLLLFSLWHDNCAELQTPCSVAFNCCGW